MDVSSANPPLGPVSDRARPRCPTVRVLTYNIHGWRDAHGQIDVARLARIIQASQADIVALNEVFHPLVPPGETRPALDLLAEALGMSYAPAHDPLALADATIFLPTRRAARALAPGTASTAQPSMAVTAWMGAICARKSSGMGLRLAL